MTETRDQHLDEGRDEGLTLGRLQERHERLKYLSEYPCSCAA